MTPQQQMIKELRGLSRQYSRATATVEELERRRAEAYVRARQLDPPITYKAIADVFEITEAAVMQKIKRAEQAEIAGQMAAAGRR